MAGRHSGHVHGDAEQQPAQNVAVDEIDESDAENWFVMNRLDDKSGEEE